MGHRHHPGLRGTGPSLPKKGDLGRAAHPTLVSAPLLPPFPPPPPRQMRERRKGVIMAIFSLGFLWLCSPEVGEMHFVSIAGAVVFFQLLISVKDKVLQPLAGPAESNSKSQDWYPKGPAWSVISHHYSGGNIYPNGGRAHAGFC